MRVEDLDTPAVIVDLDILEKNIRYMAEHCKNLGINLRVHTKTHKIPEIAHWQLAAGAVGICCQKLGDAEVMCAAGIKDILVPYPIVGEIKLERLMRLAKRAKMMVAVDSEEVAQGILTKAQKEGCSLRMLVELDTGGKRCGVQSPEAAVQLAKKIVAMPNVSFEGVMTFPSRIDGKPFMEKTLKLLKEEGIPANIISGGGTGLEAVSKELGCNEHRSGSYAFEGSTRINRDTNPPNPRTCAVRVICTVVSTPTPDRIIIDGGMKTFTSYPPTPYGYIVEHPEAKIYAMSVEHGHVNVSACKHKFRVGERLSVIPLHQEMTLNLHDELVGVRDGKVEVIWPVAGRGKVK